MKTAAQIRRSFLEYFARNGHQRVPSSPLIPKDDPTLLFTNAGMVQFKQVFLGQEKRDYTRATTAQKCLRVGGKHNDLENVGRTARHHTFFEMLGNFSFGDYFKEQAIYFAWNYLTKELDLPKGRLYATVFKDDDEAITLWRKISGLPMERIYRLGEKDNFWSMGDTGPCGPCSEILIDQGEHMACGPDCRIGVCDCDRYLEIWNLVFMQFNRDESGQMTPLPKPSIDTGMGLERIAAVCQGVYSNFDCDLFSGLIEFAASLANVQYKDDHETDTALRVIADHTRAAAFMITDGIVPSNEGRGYVLRRLIRRAYRFGRLLGLNDPFLYKSCFKLVEEMGEAYPELMESQEFIGKVVRLEEENFARTLDKGLSMLSEELAKLAEGEKVIPGTVLFKLYDSYGFPLDIVRDIGEKQGYGIDESGFERLMNEQRERSKAAWAGSGEQDLAGQFKGYLERGVKSDFVGYGELSCQAKVLGLLDVHGRSKDLLSAGEQGYLIVDQTPFYGESGGQVGDQGWIVSDQVQARVVQTLKPGAELVVHQVEVQAGGLQLGEELQLQVDKEQRKATARNHTCTHLLHAALRKVLGEHVKQAGSLVGPDRLRFDFTHVNPLSAEEIRQVEKLVNGAIMDDLALQIQVLDYEQAMANGAIGLFSEKYASKVRVVEVPGVSKELCGGTHLVRTGEAGFFCVLSETGIASGVRRIEAATGSNALKIYQEQREILHGLSQHLKVKYDELPDKVIELQEALKKARKEKEEILSKQSALSSEDLLDQQEDVAGVKVLATEVDLPGKAGMKVLRTMMDNLRTRFGSGIILLAGQSEGKVNLLLAVSKDLLASFQANELIKDVAKEVGGGGGGRPDLAQAGGSNPERLPQAFARLKSLIKAGNK